MSSLAINLYRECWTEYSGSNEYVAKKSKDIIHKSLSCGGNFTGLNTHPVFAITLDGMQQALNFPIILKTRSEDGFYFAENEEFDISGVGESKREALKNATIDIAYLWKHYTSIDDDKLMGEGLKYKELFNKLI